MTIKQQIKKLQKFDIVSISWEDITAICEWLSKEQIKELQTLKCHTVGFFLGCDGDSVKISYSYQFDEDCGAVEIIPIGVILGITRHGTV